MAFDSLQKLGEEKFQKILNALLRGEQAVRLARTIQLPPPDGWGDYQGVAETTLTAQLTRLRQAAAEGIFGARRAKEMAERAGKPHIDRLNHISVPVLARIEEVSEAQRTLVMVLLEKATSEKRTYKSVNDAVNNYRQTLLDIQKLRFEMGLDEFKGPIAAVRGASQTTTFPNGMSVEKQVFEAITTVEHIFDARKIPQLIARE